MKKLICLFLCVCMLWTLGSPALAAEIDDPVAEGPVDFEVLGDTSTTSSTRMKERELSHDGVHLNWYYIVYLYARPDRICGRIGYQDKTTLGVNLYILSGNGITGWVADVYDKTTSSNSTNSHEHLWDSGIHQAISVVAKYLVRGSNIYSLSTSDLQ